MGFQDAGMRKVATILKSKGIKVTAVEGWTTRGGHGFDPRAVVCHWTGAGQVSTTSMLVNGRKGEDPIPGPLCNFEVLPGGGGVKLIAAGRANHNAPAKTGFSNSGSFGIEAAGPPIVDAEFKVYTALVAAICKVYKIPVNQGVRDHHAAAGGLPGRKPDITVPVLGITLSSAHNMNTFRDKVSRLLGEQEDDFMALFDNLKEFKDAVREVVNEELERRLKGGVVRGQENVGGTLAVIADHVDLVLEEVRKP
jgi:N-acetylmuramoyl-L-alanine amidase